ncbi:MAG: hypothetical protein ACRBCJ_10580 [Hyphomicrobiaceae bacterium]
MPKTNAIIRYCVVVVSALLLLGPTPAGADQTFVCNDGTSVTVAFAELAKMKKTNACVASYFKRAPAKTTKTQSEVATRSGAKKPTAHTPDAALVEAKLRPTKQATRKSKAKAVATAPVAFANTDFRNVRIINAKPGARAIYRHHQ